MKTQLAIAACVLSALTLGKTVLGTEPPPPSATPAVTNGIGPKIQFAEPVHDFGKISAGEAVKYDFVFTNAGDAMLEITGVQTSCGCTTAGNWPRQLEPGKTGAIPIQFSSGSFNGQIHKTITVTCNDKTQPTVVLQIKGTIWKPIEVNPQYATLNVTTESVSNATTVVRIVNNYDEPITVSDPESNSRAFAAELRTKQPGKEFELIIKTVPPLPIGNAQGQFTLKTSAPKTPVLTITAIAIVQPVLTTTPAQIALPITLLTNSYTASVSIRNNGTAPLALSEPAVNVWGVDTQMREVEPGRLFTVTLMFPAGFQVTPGENAELHVKSNHPQFPVIKVPVMQPPRPAQAAGPSGRATPPAPPLPPGAQ
jgi:hypothetical protein